MLPLFLPRNITCQSPAALLTGSKQSLRAALERAQPSEAVNNQCFGVQRFPWHTEQLLCHISHDDELNTATEQRDRINFFLFSTDFCNHRGLLCPPQDAPGPCQRPLALLLAASTCTARGCAPAPPRCATTRRGRERRLLAQRSRHGASAAETRAERGAGPAGPHPSPGHAPRAPEPPSGGAARPRAAAAASCRGPGPGRGALL